MYSSIFELSVRSPRGDSVTEQVEALLAFSGALLKAMPTHMQKMVFKTIYPLCADFTRLCLLYLSECKVGINKSCIRLVSETLSGQN